MKRHRRDVSRVIVERALTTPKTETVRSNRPKSSVKPGTSRFA